MSCDYLGIDLTSRASRPSAYALLSDDDAPPRLGFLGSDKELFELVARHNPWAVAIDAPLGLPLGWRCLEQPCACGHCAAATEDRRRACEVELRQRGIPCYWTTRRSIIKAMVYRGIGLRRTLTEQGVRALEVYPYGIKRVLWGSKLPKKTTPAGLAFLWGKLGELFPSLSSTAYEPNHDLADALLAAYAARLHGAGRTVLLGIESEGQIVLPEGVGIERR